MSGPARSTFASAIVEASAGTGKTRALVSEIVRAVREGVDVARIVAVTFTHAAAGEMKIRVRQQLDRERAGTENSVECERLSRGLQTLDRAFIGTIHAFCAHLIRMRPVEACVDPAFEELAQPDAQRVFARVFRRWFEKALAAPSPALRRALARLALTREPEGADPAEALRRAAQELAEWRDHDAPWERRPIEREARIGALMEQARVVNGLRERLRTTDRVYRDLQPLADLVAREHTASIAGARDLDLLEAELIELPRALRWVTPGGSELGAALTTLLGDIAAFRTDASASLVSELRDDLWQVVEAYDDAKRRAGQLDFLDLLIQARNLLRNDGARADLQRRYDRVYVDEFQDTDPLQAEILLLLAAGEPHERDWQRVTPDVGKFFAVGDPKQSIYRFRRADARLYRRIHDRLVESGVERRSLTASRRSTDVIQQFVNDAFRESIPEYLPLSGGEPAPVSQPGVLTLPIPRPYGTQNISKVAINACTPGTVAAFVEWLISASNWTVREPLTGERRPVSAEHVCILFRRFTNMGADLTQEYVRCLEARGIRHVLVGSKSFHQREEVGSIRTALRAVEWPDDELSVYAVLRGSLFFVDDGTLLKFWQEFGRFSPLFELPEEVDEDFAPIRDCLTLLRELHRRRNYRPLADTIHELIEYTRAHASFAFRKGGERVLANVYRLTDLARSFEAGGAPSFRAFVEYLEEEAATSGTTEAPVLEQQAGGVRLMTVHRAKGLEFPVVILADPTAKLTSAGGADRYVDETRRLCARRLLGWSPWELIDHAEEEARDDEDEALRIAYVAATRARDLLVVTAVGETQSDESWLAPLYDAVYPPKDQWRTSRDHPGCPRIGGTTVLNRPPEMREETSVRPGMHRSKAGGEIVWFDPAALVEPPEGGEAVEREELLQGTPEQSAAGLARYREWQGSRAAMIAAGSEPHCTLVRMAEVNDVPAEAASIPVEVIPAEASGAHPAGRRFGRLVHAVLQYAHTASDLQAVAVTQARKLRCSDADAAAAAEVARGALQHPILRACAGQQLHREYPVVVRLNEHTIADGAIDLAWTDGRSWTILDYKTGPAAQARYRRQLQLYGYALQRATGLPVRCVLFEI